MEVGNARGYRLEAQRFREMAKAAPSEGIRRDLESLALRYEELADYVEASAKAERATQLLIVEDEFLVAEALKMILEDAGMPVVGHAPSKEGAMRLASSHTPDLALVDLHLASGENGCDVSTALWRDFLCPSLLHTASTDYVAEHRCGIGYLAKPAAPVALIGAVSLALTFIRTGLMPKLSDDFQLWPLAESGPLAQ
jgi:DNA-binding NarL/FixJ family response regulator